MISVPAHNFAVNDLIQVGRHAHQWQHGQKHQILEPQFAGIARGL